MIQLFDLATKYENVRFSPFCWRIKLSLAHKGLEWKDIPVFFTEKHKLPTPNDQKVPILVDGDTVIHDSWDIALYLDKQYTDAPLFDSPESMSQSLFIKHWTEASLHALISRVGIMDFYEAQPESEQDYFRTSREARFGMTLEQWGGDSERYKVELNQAFHPVRMTVSKQAYLGGVAPNFSDYIVFGTLQWLRCGTSVKVFNPDDPIYDYRERLLDLYDGLGRSGAEYPSH